MRAGPSKMTASISKVWSNFIPEEQWHTFSRGGYYARGDASSFTNVSPAHRGHAEVVPGKLVVVSLNTILWFNNNKVVDGCPAPQKGRTIDPGMEQLRWLHAQLDQWREAGLQVILSGHVPPSDYYEGCYTKFAEMSLAFQDTIVASVVSAAAAPRL